MSFCRVVLPCRSDPNPNPNSRACGVVHDLTPTLTLTAAPAVSFMSASAEAAPLATPSFSLSTAWSALGLGFR